jgi:hypothetical protein
MGLQSNTLNYWHEGRQHRLTGPKDGRVVEEIFA